MRTSLALILSLFSLVYLEKFEYLSDYHEGDNCLLINSSNIYGKCVKVVDCEDEFARYRRNEKILKICEFKDKPENSIICCPSHKTHRHQAENFLDLDVCRNRYLSTRANTTSIEDVLSKKNITDEDCRNINTYGNLKNLDKRFSLPWYECRNNSIIGAAPLYGFIVQLGDWHNMAALGWTQNNRKIEYNCGGVIISDRFIITAAHCRYKGKNPDTIRVGDRYLDSPEDDIYSQQLTVEKFIPHPDYKSIEVYNDIAVIKTIEKIFFNEFVAPACIAEVDDNLLYTEWKYRNTSYDKNLSIKYFYEWRIAGYGQTEKTTVSNVLIEINIEYVPNEICSQTYEGDPRVPRGILPSQICVMGEPIDGYKSPDSCFGDSGGPLQFKEIHEVKNLDYDRTYLKTLYKVPMLIGLVSFGSSCGLNVPSVNTRVAYYRDWIEYIMRN